MFNASEVLYGQFNARAEIHTPGCEHQIYKLKVESIIQRVHIGERVVTEL